MTIRVESDPVTQQPRRIDVIDTGIGIPAEQLEGIFERFQQADNSLTRHYGGTGLGLTIARSLCQLLGYQLTVHSEMDKGSTFSVIFTACMISETGEVWNRRYNRRPGGVFDPCG